MALTEAKQSKLLAGCNSLERKLFNFVPIQEPWDAKVINHHFHAGGNTSEHVRLRAALGGLKDRGLIREMSRDHFQRVAVKIRELREPVERERPSLPRLGDTVDVNAIRRAVVKTPVLNEGAGNAQVAPLAVAVAINGSKEHLVEKAVAQSKKDAQAKAALLTDIAVSKIEKIAASNVVQTEQKTEKTKEAPMVAQAKAVAPVDAAEDSLARMAELAQTAVKIALSSKSKLAELSSLAEQISEETEEQLRDLSSQIEELALTIGEVKPDPEMEALAALVHEHKIDAKMMKKFLQWKALMASLSDDD